MKELLAVIRANCAMANAQPRRRIIFRQWIAGSNRTFVTMAGVNTRTSNDGGAMEYLDVTPLLDSLLTAPEDFTLKGKWLVHRPSRHGFAFDPQGRVEIDTTCACGELQVNPAQERPLFNCFRHWEAHYWRPLSINREFASHFRLSWRGLLIRLTTRLASWLAEEQSS